MTGSIPLSMAADYCYAAAVETERMNQYPPSHSSEYFLFRRVMHAGARPNIERAY